MQRESAEVREALEEVVEATNLVFDALIDPYESLAATEPDATIGAPQPVRDYVRPDAVHALAEKVVEGGRPGWALYEVEERERQVRDLVRDYRSGRYANLSSAEWVGKVRQFKETVLADIRTALQAPRGWDRIDLGQAPTSRNNRGFGKSLLTPKDVAPQLRLDERTVRRQIQAGKLGPWLKQNGRWSIPTEAFLRHWADQLLDGELPDSGAVDQPDEALRERLLHFRLHPDGQARG